MKVKINCVLVYGKGKKILPGKIFEGKFEELPDYIQGLVKKGCLYIEVIEDAPKPIVTKEIVIKEIEIVKVESKKIIKKVSKPKKLVKKTKK